jgi:hypothetical protein
MMRWVWNARGREDGAVGPEYVGVVVVVALLIGALLLTNPGVQESVATSFRNSVCAVLDQGCQVALDDDGGDNDDGDNDGNGGDNDGGDGDGGGGGDPADPAPNDGGGGGDGGGGDDGGGGGDGVTEFLGDILRGFAAQIWDEITGIRDVLASIWNYFTDSDYRRQINAVIEAFIDDPIGFGRQIIAGLWGQLQSLLQDGLSGETVGRGIALALLAALGYSGIRATSTLSRVINRLDPDVLRRAARGEGPDPDTSLPDGNRPDACPAFGLPAHGFLLAATSPALLAQPDPPGCGPNGDGNDDGDDGDTPGDNDNTPGPPTSVGEAVSNPSSLGGRTPDQVQQVFEDAGFTSSGTRGRSGGVRFSNDAAGVHIRYSEGQTGRHFRDEEGSGQPYWHISVANGNPPQLWVGPDGSVYSTPPTYRGGVVENPGVRLESAQELPPAVRRALGIE